MTIKDVLVKIVFLSALAASCKNNTSNDAGNTSADSTAQQPKDKEGNNNRQTDLQQLKESLGQLSPLAEGALRALLPPQLLGVNHGGAEISSGSGTLAVTAVYTISDSSSIQAEMLDCGGPAGAGIFALQYADLPEENGSDEETTFTRSEINGYKAFESCMKSRPADCTLTFFDGKRLLVYLQGTNTGLEDLRKAAGAFRN